MLILQLSSMLTTYWDPKISLIEGEFHQRFLREAYLHAWNYSEDEVTKTGAVIVNPTLNEILAYGVNHYPEGLNPTPEQRQDKNWKYGHIIHAEPSAIFAVARNGKSTKDAVMYMPWVPCVPCANAIIDSGIKKLIGHKEMIMMTPERWWESTGEAIGQLKKCGVEMCMYDVQ